MQRFSRTLFVATFALLATTVCQAQTGIKRKPLSLSLFLKPFKPQTVTPQLFGLLPENEYLQKEIKLTDAQKKRMRQIEIQLTRLSTVLQQPDVRKAVGVTDTQMKRFANRRAEARKKAEALGKELRKLRDDRKKEKKRLTRKDLAEFRKRAAEIDAEYDEAVLNELTRGQKERFERLKGDEFEAKKIFNKRALIGASNYTLTLGLFSRPFKPQSTTPKVFGIVSDAEYLKRQLKLSPAQAQRMRQIEIQLTRVSRILIEKDIRRKLSISQKQRQSIERLRSDALAKLRNLGPPFAKRFTKILAEKDGTEQRKALKELQRQMKVELDQRKAIPGKLDEAVLKVLTETQRKQFEELKGKPVDPAKIFQPNVDTKTKRPDV